jgi:hypothetical protein
MTRYALAFLVFLLSAVLCISCGKDMPTPVFVNHEHGLLRVDNELNQRLIFFAGPPARETYLGGVPGNVTDFGLDLANGHHLITAVKVEDYMFFKTNAAAMPVAYSRPVVIDAEPYTLTVKEGALFSGQGKVLFHNKTDGFVEVRIAEIHSSTLPWQGTNIAVFAPQSSRTQHLPCMDFALYPVRLDWMTNNDGGFFKETRLSNSAQYAAVYHDGISKITIAE